MIIAVLFPIFIWQADCSVTYHNHTSFLRDYSNPHYKSILHRLDYALHKTAFYTLPKNEGSITVDIDTQFLKLSLHPAVETLEHSILESLTNLEELILNGNSLKDIRNNAFGGMNKLRFLDLSKNRLSWLRNESFKGLDGLKVLDLSSNAIDKMETGAFDGLKPLNFLILDDNKIKSVPYTVFNNKNVIRVNISINLISSVDYSRARSEVLLSGNKIQNIGLLNDDINSLDLSHNNISVLTRLTFSPSSNLSSLSLAYNEIVAINKTVFNGLHKLTSLSLEHNRLKVIHRALFRDTKALQVLDLSSNSLHQISHQAFYDLPQLKFLDLSNNQLKRYDFKLLTNQMNAVIWKYRFNLIYENGLIVSHNLIENISILHWNTSFIDLSYNNITNLPIKAFVGYKYVNKLKLSHNQIVYIRRDTFNGTEPLTFLWLDNNKLLLIQRGVFQNLLHLAYLDLSHNKIQHIEEGAFFNMFELKTVKLENNLLSNWKNLQIVNRPVYVDMSNNNLSKINFTQLEGYVFLSNNNIQEIGHLGKFITGLDLSHNNFQKLKPNEMAESKSLLILKFSSNQIDVIEKDSFKGLIKLRSLDLSNNSIQQVSRVMFTDLKSLFSLCISSNKISNIDSYTFAEMENLRRLIIQNNNLTEIRRSMWGNLKRLIFLDLSRNNIRYLHDNAFADLRNLHGINLSGNLLKHVDLTTFHTVYLRIELHDNCLVDIVIPKQYSNVKYIAITLDVNMKNMQSIEKQLKNKYKRVNLDLRKVLDNNEKCRILFSDDVIVSDG